MDTGKTSELDAAESDVPRLLAVLASVDGSQRGDLDALDRLVKHAEYDDEVVRLASVEAIARLHPPTSSEHVHVDCILWCIAARDGSSRVRAAARDHLTRMSPSLVDTVPAPDRLTRLDDETCCASCDGALSGRFETLFRCAGCGKLFDEACLHDCGDVMRCFVCGR